MKFDCASHCRIRVTSRHRLLFLFSEISTSCYFTRSSKLLAILSHIKYVSLIVLTLQHLLRNFGLYTLRVAVKCIRQNVYLRQSLEYNLHIMLMARQHFTKMATSFYPASYVRSAKKKDVVYPKEDSYKRMIKNRQLSCC